MCPVSDLAIEARTVNQRAYERLCDVLVTGACSPGERLDERTLAVRMGISRTPLREAVGRLVNEGVVEHRPYQGNFVRTFTPNQVFDLYEVRKELESLAVRWAAVKIGPAEIEQLREIVDACHAALDAGDLVEFEAADHRFHTALAEFSENETLISCLARLNLHIQLVRHLANQEAELRKHTKVHREGIVKSLAEGDIDEAASLMRAHIEEVQSTVVDQLTEQ